MEFAHKLRIIHLTLSPHDTERALCRSSNSRCVMAAAGFVVDLLWRNFFLSGTRSLSRSLSPALLYSTLLSDTATVRQSFDEIIRKHSARSRLAGFVPMLIGVRRVNSCTNGNGSGSGRSSSSSGGGGGSGSGSGSRGGKRISLSNLSSGELTAFYL